MSQHTTPQGFGSRCPRRAGAGRYVCENGPACVECSRRWERSGVIAGTAWSLALAAQAHPEVTGDPERAFRGTDRQPERAFATLRRPGRLL